MKNLIVLATMALSACSTTNPTKEQPMTVAPAQKQPLPVSGSATVNNNGLSDLSAMVLSCPQAGLNAAAREAAKVPSQGHYQFSYFRIINDSHHSLYEVHFTSNDQEEGDLKYCVSVYCQQGQTPAPVVSLIGDKPRSSSESAAHRADCGIQLTHQDRL